MVDVSSKAVTARTARARAVVAFPPGRLAGVLAGEGPKGPIEEVARAAGILAAKRTGELIPLCHPLMLSSVKLELVPAGTDCLEITATVKVQGVTGVEMEALTACSIAALTVYDMCKAVDKDMVVEQVRLLEKKGGKSGPYVRASS